MEEDEERQKKLRAGKEKFAQFLKKKHSQEGTERKKKRKKGETVTNSESSESSLAATDLNPSSGSIILEIPSEIGEGEISTREHELKARLEGYNIKIEEYQHALSQRDEIISQLTKSLQTTIAQRDKVQTEANSQAESLAAEINTLKLQLQQASEILRSRSDKNGVSCDELFEAKKQIVSLEQLNLQKDETLKQISEQLSHKVEELANFQEQSKYQLNLKHAELENFRKESSANEEKLVHRIDNLSSELSQRSDDLNELKMQLQDGKQKSSDEVKQLMRTIEVLQQQLHLSSQNTTTLAVDVEQQMACLRAELDETYGNQIVLLKEEMKEQQQEQLKELHNEINQLVQEKEQMQTQMETLRQQQAQNFVSQTNEMLIPIEKLKDCSDVQTLNFKLEETLREKNNNEHQYRTHIDQLSYQIMSIKEEKHQQENRFGAELKRVHAMYQQEMTNLKLSAESNSKQIVNDLNLKIKGMSVELERYQNTVKEFEMKHKELQKHLNETRAEANKLKIDLHNIMQAKTKLENENSRLVEDLNVTKNCLVPFSSVDELKTKLREAEDKIKSLKLEKEKLIENFEIIQNSKQDDSCMDWDIAINLGDVMKEIVDLKTENANLKEKLSHQHIKEPIIKGDSGEKHSSSPLKKRSKMIEGEDSLEDIQSLDRDDLDSLEKQCINVVHIKEGGDHANNTFSDASLNHLQEDSKQEKRKFPFKTESAEFKAICESLTIENKELKKRLNEQIGFQIKYSQLQEEKKLLEAHIAEMELIFNDEKSARSFSSGREDHHQVHYEDPLELDFEFRKAELENCLSSLRLTKENLEKQLEENQLKHEDRLTKYISALKSEGCDIIEIEKLINEVTTLEKEAMVIKLQLQQEREVKSTLQDKVSSLLEKCSKYHSSQQKLKEEINRLSHDLELSWQKQSATWSDLISSRKELSSLKLQYEKQILEYKSQLELHVSAVESETIKVKKAFTVGGNKDKLSESLESHIETALKSELQKIQEGFKAENNLLKESLKKEQSRNENFYRQLEMAGITPEDKDCFVNTLEMKEKLELLMISNQELLEEKDKLVKQLAAQELTLQNLQERMVNTENTSTEFQESFGKQMTTLQNQRDELLKELQGNRDKQIQLMNVLSEKSVLEETLRREKEALIEKVKDKEFLENKVLEQKLELQRLQFEQKQLEEQLLQKDKLEQELMRQQRLLEMELAELEHRLKDQTDNILYEKSQLQMELHRKDVALRKREIDLKEKQLEFSHLHSTMKAKQSEDLLLLHSDIQESNCAKLEELRMEMEYHHAVAVARLKRQLQDELANQESKMKNKHSTELASLKAKHNEQLENCRSSFEMKLAELVNEEKQKLGIDKNFSNLPDVQDVLSKLRKNNESALMEFRKTLDNTQQEVFDEIRFHIENTLKEEIHMIHLHIESNIAEKLKTEKSRLELIYQEEMEMLKAEAESSKQSALSNLREQLNKAHKEELNQTIQSFEMQIERMKKQHAVQLTIYHGLKERRAEIIINELKTCIVEDFNKAIANLTQQWESHYLEQLSKLRKEIEEKFQQAVEVQLDKASPHNESTSEAYTELDELLTGREQLIQKAHEIRKTLEEIHTSELSKLKEKLETECNVVLDIQDKMKKESNETGILIELQKVKEDYKELKEKYEEITQEQIESRETRQTHSKENRYEELKNAEKETRKEKYTEHEKKFEYKEEKYEQFSERSAIKRTESQFTLEEEIRNLKEKLEKKHAEEMEHLRIYFEKRCEEMEKRYVEEVSQLKSSQNEKNDDDCEFKLCDRGGRPPTLTHFCDSFADEHSVLDLEEHYKKELDEKLEQYRLQLDEVRKKLEMKHAREIEKIKAEFQTKLKEERDSLQFELVNKYTEEIDEMMVKHEQEITGLRIKFAEDLGREVTKVRIECASEIASEIELERRNMKESFEIAQQEALQSMQIAFQQEQRSSLPDNEDSGNKSLISKDDSLDIKTDSVEESVIEAFSKEAIEKAKYWEMTRGEIEKEIAEKHSRELKEHKQHYEDNLNRILCQLKGFIQENESLEKTFKNKSEKLMSQLTAAAKQLVLVSKEVDTLKKTAEHQQIEGKIGEKDVKETENATELLKSQFQYDILNICQEYENKIKSTEKNWSKKLETAVNSKEKELEEKYQKEICEIVEKYKTETQEKDINIIIPNNETNFETLGQRFDDSHLGNLEEIRQTILSEHEETLQQLRHEMNRKEKEYISIIQEIKENQEKDLEELKEQHKTEMTNEIRRIQQDLNFHHEEQLQAIVLENDNARKDLESIHRKEIIELQAKLSKKFSSEKEDLELEFQKSIDDLQDKHKKEIQKLQKQHGDEIEQLKQELEVSFELQNKELQEQKEERKGHETDDPDSSHQQDICKTCDCELLRSSNERLLGVLSDLVRSYINAETTITQQLTAIAGEDNVYGESVIHESSNSDLDKSTEELKMDTGALSFLSEEGIDLDLSRKFSYQMFSGTSLDHLDEELIHATGINLEMAVTRLLRLLSITVQQCHDSKLAQIELVNAAAEHGEEAAALLTRIEELNAQLKTEMLSKEHLVNELNRITGIISTHENEKLRFENELRQQEENYQCLLGQLEITKNKLRDQDKRIVEEKQYLEKQRHLIGEGLADTEKLGSVKERIIDQPLLGDNQGLLQENVRLHSEKGEMQNQVEKEKRNLTARIQEIEQVLEIQATQNEQQLEEHQQIIEDLQQQVDALEKQLKANKQFLEEQTIEREQEREEFHRELQHLQNIVKENERLQGSENRLAREINCRLPLSAPPRGPTVDALSEQLKDKSKSHHETIQKKKHLEDQLQIMADKIGDLHDVVHSMESQLEAKSLTEQELNEQIKNLKLTLSCTTKVQEDLANELEILRTSSASDQLTSHVHYLEEQLENRTQELESFMSSQSFIQELHGQLQILEEKVEKKTKELEALQLTVSSVSSPSSEDLSLHDQLEAMRSVKDSDNLEVSPSPMCFDDVRRLEDKLEALAKAEDAAIKKTRDLEMIVKKQKQVEEELSQDKDALQQQVNNQLLKISALESRIEERRHGLPNSGNTERIVSLQEALEEGKEIIQKREKEIEELQGQLDEYRKQLSLKEAELHLSQQYNSSKDLTSSDDSLEIEQMRKENEELKRDLSSLQESLLVTPMSSFAQSLLSDKNAEIDHLQQQLEELQSQLSSHSLDEGDIILTPGRLNTCVNEIEKLALLKIDEITELKDILNVAGILYPGEEVENIVEKDLKEQSQDDISTSEKNTILEIAEEKSKKLQSSLDSVEQKLEEISAENSSLKQSLEQHENDLRKATELAEQRRREVDGLRGVLKEKQALLEQVETLQNEIDSLVQYQTRLQEDYETVQSMLEETQKELIIAQQNTDERNGHLEEKNTLKENINGLEISEAKKDSLIKELQDRLDLMAQNSALKQDELRQEIVKLRKSLETMKVEAESSSLSKEDSNQLEIHKRQLMQLKQELSETQKQFKVSSDLLHKKEEVLSDIQLKNANLKNEFRNILQEKENVLDELNNLKKELLNKQVQSETTIQLLKDSLQNNQKETLSLEQQAKEYQSQLEISKLQLQQSSEHCHLLEIENAKVPILVKDLKESQESVASLNVELQRTQKLKVDLESKLKDSENLHDKWKEINLELRNKVVDLKESQLIISTLQWELQEKQKESNNIKELNCKLIEKENDYQLLQKNLQEIEKQLEKAKDDLSRYYDPDDQLKIQSLPYVKKLEEELLITRALVNETEKALDVAKEHQRIWEAKNVLSRSEIDGLRDELEQYHDNVEKLQDKFEFQRKETQRMVKEHNENLISLRQRHEHEIEELRQRYEAEISRITADHRQLLLERRNLSMSDSGSATDLAQQLQAEVERTEKLDSSLLHHIHVCPKGSEKEHAMDASVTESESEAGGDSNIPVQLKQLMKKVHEEGVQVLSLSELVFLRNHQRHSDPSSSMSLQIAWENEKQQLLAEIVALKDLLTQATEASASLRTSGQNTAEWSKLFLRAITNVFQKEKDTLMAELRTQILTNGQIGPSDVERLEHRIAQMDTNHQEVLIEMQNMLKQPGIIPSSVSKHTSPVKLDTFLQHDEHQRLLQQIAKMEEEANRSDRHHKRQMELWEFRIQQEQVLSEDLRSNLELEKKRTLELSAQLSREKSVNADLEMSRAVLRTELLRIQAEYDREKRETMTMRAACETERLRSQALIQALEAEQTNFAQLQEAMEADKRRNKTSREREQQIIQELHQSLETAKEKQLQTAASLEHERMKLKKMQEEVEASRNAGNTTEAKGFDRVSQGAVGSVPSEFDTNCLIELKTALERERHRVATLNSTLMQERLRATEELDKERVESCLLKRNLDLLTQRKGDADRELQQLKEQMARMEAEKSQLLNQMASLREIEKQQESTRDTERQMAREHQRERDIERESHRQKQMDKELEIQKQKQRIFCLEKEVEQLKEREKQLIKDLQSGNQTLFLHSFQQQPTLHNLGSSEDVDASSSNNFQLEICKQQLQGLMLHLKENLTNCIKLEGAGDFVPYDTFKEIIQNALRDIDKLQASKIAQPVEESGNLRQFLEQVLYQNAELVGFITRLCEDKLELRRNMTVLEEELANLRQRVSSEQQSTRRFTNTSEQILATERAAWAEDRAALQLNLHRAEAEVLRLRSEFHSRSPYRSHETLSVPPSTSGSSELHDKLQQLYLKFQRAESFRKALVYQKKYLLILLGSFRETEAVTLSSIARMGIIPSSKSRSPFTRAFHRFRSTIFAVVAISRMKFLVRKWKRPVVYVSSTSRVLHRSPSTTAIRNGHDLRLSSPQHYQSSTAENTIYHPVHQIGTTPPVKDHHSSRSSRTASERSAASSARRSILSSHTASSSRMSLPADKSLNDFMLRLESIQVQLGIDPSNPSFSQLHRSTN